MPLKCLDVDHYCFCADLRLGCYIISITTAAFGMIQIGIGVIIILIINMDPLDTVVLTCAAIVYATACLMVFFAFLLFVAIDLKDYNLLIQWLAFAIFYVVMNFAMVGLLIALICTRDFYILPSVTWAIVYAVALLVFACYVIYCWVVVRSYVIEIKQEESGK